MAEYNGRAGTVYASANGSAWTQIGGVFSAESAGNIERIDATDFDSAGDKEGDYGESSVTFNVSWHRDDSDAGQDIVRTAFQGKSALYLRHRPQEAGSADQISAQVIPTSLNTTNARNARVDQALTAESTGSVTYDTQ